MYEGDENNFEAAPPEENNNKTFLIAAGILGGIVLLSLVCLAGYALFILPGQRANQLEATNAQASQAAEMSVALTSTFQASILPTMTLTPLPSPTPVLAAALATETPILPTPDPATATVAFSLTQVANAAQNVVTPGSPSNMPGTGIADEYGIPGLVVATIILIFVIILARRLRVAPIKNR